jgi:hypothetical protein
MRVCLLSLIAFALLSLPFHSQTPCAVRVDLRWFQMPNTTVRLPGGTDLPPAGANTVADFLMSRVGPIYWQEAAKKKYPEICLDAEHADYFVFWTQFGHENETTVHVLPRDKSGCMMEKIIFDSEKVDSDKERAAKQAFRETMEFLRKPGNLALPPETGCISPEALVEAIAAAQSGTEVAKGPTSMAREPSDPSSVDGSEKALLDISSTPSGADIELDGSFIGSTPSSVSVPAGEHTLAIKRKGYAAWQRKINALAGKVTITAELVAEKTATPPPH